MGLVRLNRAQIQVRYFLHPTRRARPSVPDAPGPVRGDHLVRLHPVHPLLAPLEPLRDVPQIKVDQHAADLLFLLLHFLLPVLHLALSAPSLRPRGPKRADRAPHALDGDDALSTMATHILFESASGYAIFEVKLKEEVAAMTKAAQDSIEDLAKFGKMVSLMSFSPFKSAGHALENANDISEGEFPGLEAV